MCEKMDGAIFDPGNDDVAGELRQRRNTIV